MVTLEQVEKLREYAEISYDEAKEALENAGGDVLQAIIDLERQGKINAPQGGGQYNSGSTGITAVQQQEGSRNEKAQSKGSSGDKSAFSRNMGKFFRWLGDILHKGNVNALVVEKSGTSMMRMPITILVILFIAAFWFMVPILVIGLFFDCRYYFEGPDIKSSKVNDAMGSVANAAGEIKNDMKK